MGKRLKKLITQYIVDLAMFFVQLMNFLADSKLIDTREKASHNCGPACEVGKIDCFFYLMYQYVIFSMNK